MNMGNKKTEAVFDDAVRTLARKDPKVREGELEIDPDAPISYGGDNGAYVQAWLWVSFADTPLDRGESLQRESIPKGQQQCPNTSKPTA